MGQFRTQTTYRTKSKFSLNNNELQKQSRISSEHKPQIGLVAAGSEKRDGFGVKESEEEAMEVALVSSEGRIVKSPIGKIIVSGVGVPILDWEIKSYFHPMPLGLKISIVWRIPSS